MKRQWAIVGTDGVIHYRRPEDDPLLDELPKGYIKLELCEECEWNIAVNQCEKGQELCDSCSTLHRSWGHWVE